MLGIFSTSKPDWQLNSLEVHLEMAGYMNLGEQVQEVVLQSGRDWAEAQKRLIGTAAEARSRISERLPSASEVVESTYSFATQLMQLQREAALRWVEAFEASPRSTRKAA